MEVIDIHPHAISHDPATYPFAPVGGKMSVWAEERPVDGDELAGWMDKAGIRCAALVHASTAYGYDNSYAADVVDAHKDRFRFIGAIDVTAYDAAAKCEYWVRERGMAGFRVFASGASTLDESAGAWLSDPKTFPAWEMASRLGIPVCVQARGDFPMIEVLLQRFPHVKVILDHFAHPEVSDGPPYAAAQTFFDLAKYPNLHLKLTERNFADLHRGKADTASFLSKTIAAFGSHRIAWGSNFPTSHGSLVELRELAFRELAFLPEADQENIFRNTALSLYPGLKALA